MSFTEKYLIVAGLWFIPDSAALIKRMSDKRWLFAFAERHLGVDIQQAIARGDKKQIFQMKVGLIVSLLFRAIAWPYSVLVELLDVE